jgi:hypothetical protein
VVGAVLAAMLMSCAVQGGKGSVRRLDERNGFRSARFGTPVAGFGNLKLVGTRNGFECFEQAEDDLTLGEVTLSQIHYCFYRDRLATVVLSAQGVAATQELLRSLRLSYGQGEPLASGAPGGAPVGELWRGQRVTAMLLFVQRDTFALMETGDVAVTMWSNELVTQRDSELGTGRAGDSPAR